MRDATRVPFGNMRFRLEIEGMREKSVVEVIFPEARLIAGPRRSRAVQYGTLTVRRGVTRSAEWYDWWDRGRTSKSSVKRTVAVVLLDERGADVHRWTFDGAQPLGYLLSNLNALGNAPLIETLEMTVDGFEASFDLPTATSRKRK
jgi:T4-like virus tail tube protein gp19